MTRRLLQLLVAATTATLLVPLSAAPSIAADADPEIDCINEDTKDKEATPYYDARFEQGPELSPALLQRFIPQGLTTWRNYYGDGQDLLVYTGYHEDGDTRRAVIQGVDPRDGSLTKSVRIGPGHAGGVAIHGEWAYVSAPQKQVRRYRLTELALRFQGLETDAMDGLEAGDVVGAASFLAVYGDILFVGMYEQESRSTMAKYQIRENGTISNQVGNTIEVPANTQGLLVLPEYFVYSTSFKRTKRSNIYVVKRGYELLDNAVAAGQLECFRAPTMSEGVTISQDRIYLLFESGASHYADDEDDRGVPDRVIKHLHWADREELPLLR